MQTPPENASHETVIGSIPLNLSTILLDLSDTNFEKLLMEIASKERSSCTAAYIAFIFFRKSILSLNIGDKMCHMKAFYECS